MPIMPISPTAAPVLVPHGIRGRFRDISGYFSIYQLIPAYFFLWRVSSVSVVVLPFKFEKENHLITSQLLGVGVIKGFGVGCWHWVG